MVTPIFLVVGAAWYAVLAAVIRPALRQPTDRHVESFARFHDVPLTPATRRLVADALCWTRRWRVAGGCGGALAWWAWGSEALPLNPVAIGAGMAIGNLLAEITRRPPFSGTVRVASTARRTVFDHVQRFILRGLVALWLAAAAVVVAAATGASTPNRPTTSTLVIGAGALVVGGGVLPLATLIARRPAPRDDPAVAAVLHAIRTASISSVLGGGAVLLGAGMYRVAFAVVLADGPLRDPVRHLNNAAMFVSVAAMFAGLGLVFGSFPRRVERRPGTTVAA